MIISQDEYNVTKQINRQLYVKINLLNYKFQTVDELSGTLVGNPTFSINADSDMRRTCSFSLIPTDSSFDISAGNKIWMDKYVQVFIGIYNHNIDKITYSKQGLYILNSPNVSYSAINHVISLQGIDLMAKLTGMRNGQLEGLPHKIDENSDVKEAVMACLNLAGFNQYIIEDFPIKTPYEIKVDVGGTIFDILNELRNILPNYQMYFDVDGVFHFEQIPNGKNEQIFIDDDIWESVLVDYNKSVDFSQVKNVIEVFGKTHEIHNFADKENIKIVDNVYNMTISSVTTLRDLIKIGFISTTPLKNPKITINGSKAFPILNEDQTAPILESGEQYYVVKFKEYENSTEENLQGYFEFMGNVEPHAIAKEENAESPFYVGGRLGEIREVLNGGEYDNIYTTSLAQERANWELYTKCKLKDSVSLSCIPIYWIDVNRVIEITLPNKDGTKETNQYIIKNINTNFGINGIQTIECMRYYPFYSNYARNIKE